jgi:NAD(P)-dependent dehydrogenase (short-subunit alcohol dehydrogenase family)
VANQLLNNKDNTIAEGELLDRVALITGAASGIGLAISKRLLHEGALIAMLDINQNSLDKTRNELSIENDSTKILSLRCDITKENDVVSAVGKIVEHFGKLDIAINNAGVTVNGPADQCTLEEWEWVMGVNCTGSFLVSREAIKAFKRQNSGGVLVYINSDNSIKPSKQSIAYNTSKAGVLHMARTIANEFGPDNIRANSILPGAVFGGSGMWTQEMRIARAKVHNFHPDELEEEYKKNNALGVIIDPAEIAELVVFLSSDRAAKMTGNALVIDGGGLGGYVR